MIDVNEVYPSMQDLAPDILRAHLSGLLLERVKERYANLGGKYMLPFPEWQHKGRAMNACMVKDSRQDIEEEIVDAVFNTLVLLLKSRKNDDSNTAEHASDILMMLSQVFATLETIRGEIGADL